MAPPALFGQRQPENRLEDIETNEVSLVDRAANARRFAVIKAHKDTSAMTLRSNGRGGFTRVSKEAPAGDSGSGSAPAASPASSAPPATPPSPPVPAPAPAATSSVSKAAARETLAALKPALEDIEKAATGDGDLDVEGRKKVAEVFKSLGEYLAKANPKRMGKARMAKLLSAIEAHKSVSEILLALADDLTSATSAEDDSADPAAKSTDPAFAALQREVEELKKALPKPAETPAAPAADAEKESLKKELAELKKQLAMPATPNAGSAEGATANTSAPTNKSRATSGFDLAPPLNSKKNG